VYEYAPDFVRTQFLVHNGIEPDKLPKDADSILVYADLIQPVFDLKCIACHNNDNRSGGLNLTSLDSLLVGSDNGEVLIAGNVPNSEIFKRVSMNPSDRKFMPTNGTPLSYTEILLLKEWISHDLDTTMAISSEELSPELKSRLAISYGLDARKKSFMEKLRLPIVDEAVLEKIKNNGFTIRKLAMDLNLLDIQSKDSISLEKLAILMEVKDHIVWLDLHGSKVGEEHLTEIALLKNLVRLDLHDNPINSVEVLAELQHLEVLNVHATKVNDSIVGAIERFPSLKVLYLWQSAISEQAVDSLRNLLPDLEVDFGFKLKVVVADKDKKE
jgi:Leucine-rich repeat (LRR) protein